MFVLILECITLDIPVKLELMLILMHRLTAYCSIQSRTELMSTFHTIIVDYFKNLYPCVFYKSYFFSVSIVKKKRIAILFFSHMHYTYRENSCGCLPCGKLPSLMSEVADVKKVIYPFQSTELSFFQLVERKYASSKLNCRLI